MQSIALPWRYPVFLRVSVTRAPKGNETGSSAGVTPLRTISLVFAGKSRKPAIKRDFISRRFAPLHLLLHDERSWCRRDRSTGLLPGKQQDTGSRLTKRSP